MGNYRPKSLDEIGDLYDMSVEAENEIKKGSSRLDPVKAPAGDAFLQEKTAEPGKTTPEQKAADEIATKVGDFAKSFGTSGTVRVPANIATVQSRPRVPKKKPELPRVEEGKGRRAPAQKETKAKLIRNSERTNLFDSYKRVMNDEDDSFSDGDEAKQSTSKKKIFSKKTKAPEVSPVEKEKTDASLQAQAAVAAVFGDEDKKEEASASDIQDTPAEESLTELFETATDNDSSENKNISSGNSAARIALTGILLLVLILSVAVGSIKAFTKLNSDAAAFGEYKLYSAQENYPGTNINKNDLVVVVNRQPVQGETIAYRDNSGKYGFICFESALNSESMTVSGNNSKLVVFINEYRGAVIKTVPVIGGIFAVCNTYFLPVMALMFLIIGILILLIFFTAKNKPVAEDSDDKAHEQEDEDADTREQYDTFAENPFDEHLYDEPIEADEPVQEQIPQEVPEQHTEEDEQDDGYWYAIPDEESEDENS